MLRVLVLLGVVGCIVGWPGPLGLLIGLPSLALLLPRISTALRVVACIALLLLGALSLASLTVLEKVNSAKCGSNLRILGHALLIYRDNNDGRYPPHDSARFLVQLYRAGTVRDAQVFLCPGTWDDNHAGALLREAEISAEACSYAGLQNRSQPIFPVPNAPQGSPGTPDIHPPQVDSPIASDDDEGLSWVLLRGAGDRRYNHPGFLHVLFLDGHVEVFSAPSSKIGVMGRSGLLGPLAN